MEITNSISLTNDISFEIEKKKSKKKSKKKKYMNVNTDTAKNCYNYM